MNLRICDICKADPRQGKNAGGQCSDIVKPMTIDGKEIDICNGCETKPLAEVREFVQKNGRQLKSDLRAFAEIGTGQQKREPYWPSGIPKPEIWKGAVLLDKPIH